MCALPGLPPVVVIICWGAVVSGLVRISLDYCGSSPRTPPDVVLLAYEVLRMIAERFRNLAAATTLPPKFSP